MKMKIYRILAVLLVALIALLPATALAIDPPDITFAISAVDVYGGANGILEAGDQLYIAYYIIDYTTNPTENINTAFLGRVVNGATEYGQVAPYSYFQSGYNHGIFSIYLTQGNAPAWGSPSVVRLEGNPTLSWTTYPSPVTWTLASDNWTSGGSQYSNKLNVAQRVLTIAGMLENYWGLDMVQSYPDGSQRLTSFGIDYFTNAIPNLFSLAPSVFPTGIVVPEVATKAYVKTYATEAEGRLAGTPIDNIFQSSPFGIPPLLGKLIFLMVMVGIVGFGVLKATGESKPALYLSIPVFLAGIWLGFGPFVFLAFFAFFVVIGIVWVLFLRGA